MPALRSRTIFISHAWQYSQHYWSLVNWFNVESNFLWRNCSVPSHNALPDKTVAGLKLGMTRQISPAQVVIVLGGMYAAHSGWIEYEINEAIRMNKIIIGVTPWGQQRTPTVVQNASICPLVGWNRSSIVSAVRRYS